MNTTEAWLSVCQNVLGPHMGNDHLSDSDMDLDLDELADNIEYVNTCYYLIKNLKYSIKKIFKPFLIKLYI